VFFAPLLGLIGNSDRARAPEFAEFALRLQGRRSDESSHSHFYDSDYSAHHRPEYAVFVHMVSSRTLSTECVNDENKKGRMLADGATTIYARGNQYEAVFPLLNWTMLPGTTEVQNERQDHESPGHGCGAIREGTIRRHFVGGLAEGGIGVTAMDFARAALAHDPVATATNAMISSSSGGSGGSGSGGGCNASTPPPRQGVHCSLSSSRSIGTQSRLDTPELCRQHCCNTRACNCWTWTAFEHIDSSPCAKGQPCCWLKSTANAGPLVPAVNCTGGTLPERPVPPPLPPPVPCVQAAKAWFFSQNATLALGTDIRRGPGCQHMPVTTSIQQSNLFGPIIVGGVNPSSQHLLGANSSVTHSLPSAASTTSWVWHDGLVYAILPVREVEFSMAEEGQGALSGPISLTVANQWRAGTEYSITQGDNKTLTGPVFSMHVNHGDAVVSSYAYAVLASPSAAESGTRVEQLLSDVTIVSNAKPIQAICTSGQSLQLVVWPQNVSTTGRQLSTAIAASAHGCWDVSIRSTNASVSGVLLQIRSLSAAGQFAISAAAPALGAAAARTTGKLLQVTMLVTGLKLGGDKRCVVGAEGTTITVPVNGSGATSVVRCHEQQQPDIVSMKSDDDAWAIQSTGTCDFRLAESTQYSNWSSQLGALGVTTNTAININGEHLGSGNTVSLAAFLAQTATQVRAMVRAQVLPIVLGGVNSTNLLVIDVENPARPDALWSFHNSTLLQRVVRALRLRIAVLREIFPRATISYYGAPTRLHIAKASLGYQKASALGLFDELNYT
jgi:hypothetical protein